MNYIETAKAKLKPIWSFLIAFGLISIVAVTFRLMPIEQYRIAADVSMLIIIVAIVYFLYRYALTPFEYSVSDKVISISKGEKLHKKVLVVIRAKDIKLFAPADYNGKLPKGDYSELNCCPSWSGKAKGWCIWCVFEDGSRVKVHIEPSDQLISVIKELTHGRTAEM